MHLLLDIALLLFLYMSACSAATTETILAGQALTVNDKLVSRNGRYALGFFETSSKSSGNTNNWYLGIWFNTIPKFTSEHGRCGCRQFFTAVRKTATISNSISGAWKIK
uniref:non-specific serine/threonine protein kinase n=1 Tax=Aegilops tauschii subsp. strangulata TaxID=200361 RepID=A0A453SRQ9_AEGTS